MNAAYNNQDGDMRGLTWGGELPLPHPPGHTPHNANNLPQIPNNQQFSWPPYTHYSAAQAASRRPFLDGPDEQGGNEETSGSRRRTPLACSFCRKRKVRYSGDAGNGSKCTFCDRKGVANCQFQRVGENTVAGAFGQLQRWEQDQRSAQLGQLDGPQPLDFTLPWLETRQGNHTLGHSSTHSWSIDRGLSAQTPSDKLTAVGTNATLHTPYSVLTRGAQGDHGGIQSPLLDERWANRGGDFPLRRFSPTCVPPLHDPYRVNKRTSLHTVTPRGSLTTGTYSQHRPAFEELVLAAAQAGQRDEWQQQVAHLPPDSQPPRDGSSVVSYQYDGSYQAMALYNPQSIGPESTASEEPASFYTNPTAPSASTSLKYPPPSYNYSF